MEQLQKEMQEIIDLGNNDPRLIGASFTYATYLKAQSQNINAYPAICDWLDEWFAEYYPETVRMADAEGAYLDTEIELMMIDRALLADMIDYIVEDEDEDEE